MAKARSLKDLMLAYAIAYLCLVVLLGALGGVGVYLWNETSRESVRINSMVEELQEMRGNLYRQVKEVFDAVFLLDDVAEQQYQEYARRTDRHFLTLMSTARKEEEREAIRQLRLAYDNVKKQAEHILVNPDQFTAKMRKRIFDANLELGAFGSYEAAFEGIDKLLEVQRAELESRLQALTRLAPLLLVIPIVLAIALFMLTRIFLQRAFVSPISAFVDATSLMSQGDLDHKVPETGAAELITLAQAVNAMADDLAQIREALVRAEKQATLGALVPVVAHNIRNPLAGIRATAQVLDDGGLAKETREGLADIIKAADRLESWTYSLLSYLHPLKPQRSLTTLASLTDNVLEFLKPKLADKKIQVQRQGWDRAVEIALDVQLMEQAINGLITNAIEASKPGDTLYLTASGDLLHARLSIRDQGSGMLSAPETEGLNPVPTTKRRGSGLGIPFAIKVCDVHAGKVEFRSQARHGTEAIITLPRQFEEK